MCVIKSTQLPLCMYALLAPTHVCVISVCAFTKIITEKIPVIVKMAVYLSKEERESIVSTAPLNLKPHTFSSNKHSVGY